MIYQYATKDRDLTIAKALGDLVQQVRINSPTGPDQACRDAQFCAAMARVCPFRPIPVCATQQASRVSPLTWELWLERAKGIEPS